MKTDNELTLLPRQIHDIFKQNGIKRLYPPQVQALKQGLLSQKNMILSMPTASGKTLIAELAILDILFS
ncbi:MAG: hypothetical protein HY810_06065 [Candidatus Omnitrophica bacterium]|nr:hypothetical protein [Candidatus Omnitrophota bacterium]